MALPYDPVRNSQQQISAPDLLQSALHLRAYGLLGEKMDC